VITIRKTRKEGNAQSKAIRHTPAIGIAFLQSLSALRSCSQLQLDEIWGFVGKKQRHTTIDDDLTLGDVWTYCAIDADTKLVPAHKVGKRDRGTTDVFIRDLAARVKGRVQISTDGAQSLR
jgi:hypothetical protein